MAELFEKLGISWFSMLFYVINIGILILLFRFLIYKKVKKIMDNRKARIDEVFIENEKLNAEALEQKHKYEQMLTDAKQKVAEISGEVIQKAEAKGEKIIADASTHAEEIMSAAKLEVAAERMRLQSEYKSNISELAIEVAEKILEREINKKDNQKIIDECLNEWSN